MRTGPPNVPPKSLRRLRGRTFSAGAVIGEGEGRVQIFVHEIFVTGAVILVGAGLHRDVEETATRLSEFRGVVAGLHGHFLNGVRAGLIFLQRVAHRVVRVVETLDAISRRVASGAVDDHGEVRVIDNAGDHDCGIERIAHAGTAGVGAADAEYGQIL